jgi:hypothetical protein
MAIIDNTLAAQIPTFDAAAPLAQAAQLQSAETSNRAAQFKQAQLEIGAEARGLQTYVNTPEFAQRWGETADRLYQKGLLDERAYKQWRNTPSPLLLKSMIASTSDPTLDFAKYKFEQEQANEKRGLDLKERSLNATIEGGKVPAGFQKQSDGTLAPIKGGPQDPEYLKEANAAKEKPRNMSISDITKLSEEGGKFANITGFVNDFKDEYAGHTIVGEGANVAGRYLPEGVVGKSTKEGADWWQGYDRYKNVVRNELFGSALTATEKAAFEKADIGPRMDPETIKTNLKKQKEIVESAIKRKAQAAIDAGYKPDAIASAYGVSLESLGIKTDKGSAKLSAPSEGTLANARRAIQGGADPEAVKKKMRDSGYDPSGL